MSAPISALELYPEDLMREVSPEALRYYADDLSGIYLPEDFKAEHNESFGVETWDPKKRLSGKFGRFTLRAFREDDEIDLGLGDVLVMGTTIGLTGLDRNGFFNSLYHSSLADAVSEILDDNEEIDYDEIEIEVNAADYGSTMIVVKHGLIKALDIGGSSMDYGRATAEGRQITYDLFKSKLGDEIEVVNSDPEPREHEQIIRQR